MEPTAVLLPEPVPVNVEDEMKSSYLAYAMSVIGRIFGVVKRTCWIVTTVQLWTMRLTLWCVLHPIVR